MKPASENAPTRPPLRWTLAALVIFLCALFTIYGDVWREDPGEVVPSFVWPTGNPRLVRTDQIHAVWVISRDAHAFVTNPLGIFDAEQCFPQGRTLALGEPMLPMGLLAAPVYLLTENPVLSFNAALGAIVLLSSLAMFLLVSEWSASPAAGVVAGLLYGFHAAGLRDPLPFNYSTVWTLWALYFARRLFAHGRWRDAIGLAASASIQVSGSLYPLIGGGMVFLAVSIWLLVHYRLRHARPAQLVLPALLVAAVAVLVFTPYLELRSAAVLQTRGVQTFAVWSAHLPGGFQFLGWLCVALIAASLLLPRRKLLAGMRGDPRGALVAGALLAAVTAAGPGVAGRFESAEHAAEIDALATVVPDELARDTAIAPVARPFVGAYGIPDVYAILAHVLPGFDTVRQPWRITGGVRLAACILAGLGCAGALRLWRWRLGIAPVALIVAISFVATLRPAALGLKPPLHHEAFRVQPDPEAIRFYEVLAEKGSSGPLFEWPVPLTASGQYFAPGSVRELLLSVYHHRRTSACYASSGAPHLPELVSISKRLPSAEAIRDLQRLGFTTVVVHRHPKARGPTPGEKAFARAARAPDAMLRPIHGTPARTAYSIEIERPTREAKDEHPPDQSM